MNKLNLFCLPFAGGNKYSYRGYLKNAPPNLNLIPVELPGRGARFREPLLTDAHAMAEDVLKQIEPMLSEPYAIYGHSMGTLIGYILTRKIISKYYPKPRFLVFTGSGGPSVRQTEPVRYNLPKEQFIQKVRELGGCPEEILQDDNIMLFFEPILRSDFQVVETFQYREAAPFDIPISVMVGLGEKITYDQAMAWKKESTANVDVRQFPGKHFFIFDYEREIMEIISNITFKLYNDEESTRLSKA